MVHPDEATRQLVADAPKWNENWSAEYVTALEGIATLARVYLDTGSVAAAMHLRDALELLYRHSAEPKNED